MSKLFLSLFLALLIAAVFLPAMAVAAAEPGGGVVKLENPLGSTPERVDIRLILGGIINKVMGVLGGLALLAFVAGGFMWLISAGNQELVKKGSKTMVWAAIGIFIIFSSYAILNLLFTGLKTKGGPSEGLQLTPVGIPTEKEMAEEQKQLTGCCKIAEKDCVEKTSYADCKAVDGEFLGGKCTDHKECKKD